VSRRHPKEITWDKTKLVVAGPVEHQMSSSTYLEQQD
jgi:hypothetical protein